MNSGAAVMGMMLYRYRKLYIGFSGYLLLLIAVAHLPSSWLPDAVFGILCMPFMLGLLATVFGFVNIEADITSPASACSPWLLRMPVKTSTLALWPMCGAALWSSSIWIVFSSLYLQAHGIHGAIWWPATMMIALSLNLQAILWAPVRRGGVRLVVAIVMTLTIALFGLIATQSGWTDERVIEIYAIVAILSATGAWAGISKARTSPPSGLASSSHRKVNGDSVVILKARRPFSSPQSAQFWLEWHRQGRLLPIFTAFGLLAISLPLFFSHDVHYLDGTKLRVNIWMTTAIQYLPWIPLLFATVIGMGAHPSDLRGSEGVYHLYHATRPMMATDLYRAKMRSILAGILLTAAMTIAVMLTWLWIPALNDDGTSTPYLLVVVKPFHIREWATMFGIAVTLIAWAWRNQAVGAFVDYLPSRKLATAYPYAIVLTGTAVFITFGASGPWLQSPSSVLPVSIALGCFVALKLGLAIAFAVKLANLRPSSLRDLLKAFGFWAAVGAVAASTLGWIIYELPKDALPASFQHPAPELFALLLVPLVRPFAARMALEYGRHR